MTSFAGVLVPITITDAMVTYTNVSEPSPGETLWNSGNLYVNTDTNVVSPITHRRYRCLQANNDKDPSILANLDIFWADIGPSNARAMFDGSTSYQTTRSGSISVVIKPGFFNGMCIFGIDAAYLDVIIKDTPGGTVIKEFHGSMEGAIVSDWYEYYFSPFSPVTDFVLTDITPFYDSEISITLTGGTTKCGIIGLGDYRTYGITDYGAKASPRSYSGIKQNSDGSQSIRKKRSGNDLSITCNVKLEDANKTHATFMEVMDTPAMWVGTDLITYAALRTWGLGSGSLTFPSFNQAVASVNVIGIIK